MDIKLNQDLDAQWIPITNETTLNENDLIGCWEVIEGVDYYIVWRVLGKEFDFIENMIAIQEMSRLGRAIKKEKRITLSVAFDYLIEHEFSLLLDKSYDQINWPESLDEAILTIKSQFSESQLIEIQNMDIAEFEDKYLSLGSWIRNHFGLWRGNFALLLDCDEDNPEPDNVSTIIIKNFWQSLQKY